jgi:hypothetical protein
MVEIMDVKKVYVCAKTYNTIRSFYNSSEKSEYEWNRGVKVASDIIQFLKISKDVIKWRLLVYFSPTYKIIDQVWLYNPDYTAAVTITPKQITIVSYEPETKPIVLNRHSDDLIATYVYPVDEFQEPISLKELEAKLLRYIRKVSEAINMPFGYVSDDNVVYAEVI